MLALLAVTVMSGLVLGFGTGFGLRRDKQNDSALPAQASQPSNVAGRCSSFLLTNIASFQLSAPSTLAAHIFLRLGIAMHMSCTMRTNNQREYAA